MSIAALDVYEPEVGVEDRFYNPHPKQFAAFESTKRYVWFFGGWGTGKSDLGSVWTANKAMNAPEGMIGLIAANSYSQLIDSTLRRAYIRWKELGVEVYPETLPSGHKPFSIWLWGDGHWVEILCRSLDNFEIMAGLEIGFFWNDEAWGTDRDAFDMECSRLRDDGDGSYERQGLITSTPDDPAHWMHEDKDPTLNDEVFSATRENAHNLPEGYEQEQRSRLSKQAAARNLDAKVVSLGGSVIYGSFSKLPILPGEDWPNGRDGNVTDLAEFDPALPILWSHDFNIGQGKPMSSCLAQQKRGPHGIELHVFDEQILESTDTNDTITEFKQRRPGLSARIYGDASGRAKDTRSKTTDYELLRGAGFHDQRVPASNPPIRDRHNAVNALLCNAAGHVRLRIHPRCKTLIKGLETVKLRTGAQYLEDETYEQHVTTALGYLVAVEFPVVERRVESGTVAVFRRR